MKALFLGAALLVLIASVPSQIAGAAPTSGHTLRSTADDHGDSPPVSNAPAAVSGSGSKHEAPLHYPKAPSAPTAATSNGFDGAGQTDFSAYGTSVPSTPALGVNFAGQDHTTPCGCAPPDANVAVGATQVVQWVNNAFDVFDKSGNLIKGPVDGNMVFSGLSSNDNCRVDNDGDPTVNYDQVANRWVLTQFAIRTHSMDHNDRLCIAVSTSSDATGTFHAWSFTSSALSGSNLLPDYPKLSVWPASGTDAYLASINLFSGNAFQGSDACAFNREQMLSGGASPSGVCSIGSTSDTMLPASLDGGAGASGSTLLPPTNEPGYFMDFDFNGITNAVTLEIWQLQPNWSGTPTFTGPTTLTPASFFEACGGGTCVPQLDPSQQLDTLADRLMYRLAYRNFGDHESMVVTQSVVGPDNTSAPRWYELRQTTNTSGTYTSSSWSIYQQSSYAPDANYRWMGSAAMDRLGDIAVGYSESSNSMVPSIDYATRGASDPLNNLRPEVQLLAGGGSQINGLSRWGDYTSMAIDPTNDCTFWYTNEYLPADGSFNWSTWIGSFTTPNCRGAASAAPPSASFANQQVGTSSKPQLVQITNTGGATLNISSVTVAGTNPGDFATSSDTCSGASLAVSGTCSVKVTFAPAAGGDRSAQLSLVDDGSNSPQAVPLSGKADSALVAVVGNNGNLYANQDGAGYASLGGPLTAAPAVVAVPTASGLPVPLYIGVGSNHNVYIRSNTTGWQALSTSSLYCNDSVGATVTGAAGSSTLTVACDGSDHALWYAQGAVTTTALPSLNTWHSLGGVLTGGPAVASVGSTVTFFALGGGGSAFTRTATTGYTSLNGAACKGHPSAAMFAGITYFACHGNDDALWYSVNSGSGWGAFVSAGGTLIDGTAMAVTSTVVTVWVEGTNTGIYHTTIPLGGGPSTAYVQDSGAAQFGTGGTGLVSS